MTTSCCPALPLPACSDCGTLPCPMSCTNWRLPARALSMVDCALGNGVVHQNLGFLLTGTTSARSVSTRSRERLFPWVMIPHNHRREYWRIFFSFILKHGLKNIQPCKMFLSTEEAGDMYSNAVSLVC